MRKFLFILLVLALPLQAWASLGVGQAPCPMDDMAIMASIAADDPQEIASEDADCCNDLATYFQTGESCKTGLKCSPSAGTPWVTTGQVPTSPDPTERPSTRFFQLLDGTPSVIWRPPANL